MKEPVGSTGLINDQGGGLKGQVVHSAVGRTKIRYKVLGLGVLLGAITYLDRICISLTARDMMRDLGINQRQMSYVFSAFILSYAIFEIPTGWWGDKVGTRKVLTRIVLWWSSFTIFTAGVFNYAVLLVIRFLFGVGEAGAWPNSAKTFSRWFPVSERGTAQGIFFMGAHAAGGLTPLLVTWMLTFMHWRWIFVVFGLFGFVWAAVWYWWFRDEPEQHSAVSQAELDHIQVGRSPAASHEMSRADWGRLFQSRSLLALCGMYLTQSYGFYFVITWLPTYLEKERGFTALQLGFLAGLPLLLSVFADLFGGLTTDRLTRRYGLRIGRSGVGFVALVLASALIITGTAVQNGYLSIILIGCAGAFANFLLGAAWGASVDMGGNKAGIVSACMNTAGQVGGFFSPIIAERLVSYSGSWSTPLYLVGILYFCGALCWIFVDPRKKIYA